MIDKIIRVWSSCINKNAFYSLVLGLQFYMFHNSRLESEKCAILDSIKWTCVSNGYLQNIHHMFIIVLIRNSIFGKLFYTVPYATSY